MKIENGIEIFLNSFENTLDAIDATNKIYLDIEKFKICDEKERYILGVRLLPNEIIWRVPREENPRARDLRFWRKWFK
jgi:hypothetical protein